MKRSWMNAGTASFDEKKNRQTVKMKKLRRFVIPCMVFPGFLNMVAIMNPMIVKTMRRERKSSGVRRMFMKFRRIRIQVSGRNEFGNLGWRWWWWWWFMVVRVVDGVR